MKATGQASLKLVHDSLLACASVMMKRLGRHTDHRVYWERPLVWYWTVVATQQCPRRPRCLPCSGSLALTFSQQRGTQMQSSTGTYHRSSVDHGEQAQPCDHGNSTQIHLSALVVSPVSTFPLLDMIKLMIVLTCVDGNGAARTHSFQEVCSW